MVAKFELIKGVRAIQIKSISNELKHCLAVALSTTSLADITVVEPSLIFLNQKKQLPLNGPYRLLSISPNIDDALQFAKAQKGFRFYPVYSY